MCRLFEQNKILERLAAGELSLCVLKSNPIDPPRPDWGGRMLVATQECSIRSAEDDELVFVHRFLTDLGEVGASGKEDPKRMYLNGIVYRLKKKGGSCEPCEGGDPIPEAERFISASV